MKHCILIILIFTGLIGHSSNYYVSSNGGDSNSGTSESLPWQTIEKVNSVIFEPGDTIKFKRGDVFFGTLRPEEDGSTTGYITYGAYGSGTKPIFHYSLLLNNQDDWAEVSENVWLSASNHNLDSDVGNIIFNNDQSFGVKYSSSSSLNLQGDFWYDSSNNSVRIYSEQNPAMFYSSVRCLFGKSLILQNNRSYITYEGLWLRYCGGFGIAGGNVDHIIVRDCDMSYLGGHYPNEEREVRVGNGIEFWARADECLVEGCKIWEIYDAGVTNQSSVPGNQTNIIYKNNIIWNCEYSFEIWHHDPNSSVNNIQFINNTCVNAGYGWGHSQRPKPSGRHITTFETSPNITNFIVKNNIFFNAKEYLVHMPDNDHDIHASLVMDYNCLFQENGQNFIEIEVDNVVYSFDANNIENYPSLTGFGGNSIFVNPMLSGFNLSSNSGCIDAGDPNFPNDPDNTLPDIGASYYHQWPSTIDENLKENAFDVDFFPNPAKTWLKVRFAKEPIEDVTIEIIDINGHIIVRREAVSTIEEFNISGQHSGLYFIKVSNGNKFVFDKLLVN